MKLLKHTGVLAFMLITVNSFAQNGNEKINGLYKTESDYTAGTLTYALNCNSKDVIRADKFFTSSKITVKENGKKTTLSKSDYYGYMGCNHKAYRFFNNRTYEIIDTAGFYMYKRTALMGGKGYVKVTEYFFSRSGNDELVALTKQNMENVFASDTQFRYAIESEFRSDNDLISYDSYLKNYKVKYLFAETAKK